MPPLADQEPGFGLAVRTLSGLGTRLGAEVVVLTPETSREIVGPAFGRKGKAPEVVGLERWRDLADAVGSLRRPDDALALVSSRPGAAAWRASLDGLPRTLADRFPDLSLFVLYPGRVPPTPAAFVAAGDPAQRLPEAV